MYTTINYKERELSAPVDAIDFDTWILQRMLLPWHIVPNEGDQADSIAFKSLVAVVAMSAEAGYMITFWYPGLHAQ